MKTEQFFRCLADNLRIQIIILLWQEGELNTEVMANTLAVNENRVRRQIALLLKNQVVVFRQKELYHYYQINTDLPVWMQKILKHTVRGNKELLDELPGPKLRSGKQADVASIRPQTEA